jgi:hypothetical protein
MAVAVATVAAGTDYVSGNKKVKVRKLTFSGNYATGGESLTASTTNVGLKKIDQVIFHGGVAAASDLATGVPVFYNHATSKVVFYEGSAAGTALSEKTNAEAYPTGCHVYATIIGY